MRLLVTGSSGKLGRATVDRLRADGHDVLGIDLHGIPGSGFTRVDLQDYGQVLDATLGVTARSDRFDAIVHLAAIPVNGLVPDATTFHNNVTATFNVAFAAHRAGIRTLVVASSITAMGFPFEAAPPSLPVDETLTAAHNTYGLGKVVEEAMFGQLVGWDPALSITALRYTNVVGDGEWDSFSRAADPTYRRDLLGTYVDVRDGADAVVAALAHARPGLHVYAIAAPDSGLSIPSPELAARWFPGTPVSPDLGPTDALVSSAKAARELGWTATRLWRDQHSAGA